MSFALLASPWKLQSASDPDTPLMLSSCSSVLLFFIFTRSGEGTAEATAGNLIVLSLLLLRASAEDSACFKPSSLAIFASVFARRLLSPRSIDMIVFQGEL